MTHLTPTQIQAHIAEARKQRSEALAKILLNIGWEHVLTAVTVAFAFVVVMVYAL